MNFDFNDKEQNFFKEITDLMQNFSKCKDLDGNNLQETKQILNDALDRLSQTSYLNLCLKETQELDGSIVLMKAMEIIANISPSLLLSVEMSTRLIGRILSAWGNDHQKDLFLAPIINGKALGAVGLSEDTMNTENDSLKTEGTPDGDSVIVNGKKSYVVNAPVADWFAVVGKMGEDHVIFLIEKETQGLVIGEPISTLGYNGVSISSLSLDNCRIPETQVVNPSKGQKILTMLRQWENLIIMGASLGIMQSSFEEAKNHAKTHKSGGKPVIAYQEVGFKLSEMLTLYQTSQLFAYRAGWTMGNDKKADSSLTDCAKVFCTEAAEKVASCALQILGGTGYLSGNASESAYRCAKYGQIAGTSTEIARVKIGDNALGIRG